MTERHHAPIVKLRHISRAVFLTWAIVLWLVALGVGAEFAVRLYDRVSTPSREAYVKQCRETGEQIEIAYLQATQEKAPVPPPAVYPKPDAPSRGDFCTATDDAACLEVVTRRGEIAIRCDINGVVTACYAPPQPVEMAEIAARIAPGTSLTELLPEGDEGQRDDAWRVFTSVAQGNPELRDYPLILANGERYVAEFTFEPVREEKGPISGMLVFVRPGLFKKLWFEYRPHIFRDISFGHWTVWTNNVGFRDEEVVLPKPPGVFRIVCIGGSTTFEGPRLDWTYPGVLQTRLRAHFNTDRVEVINCGVYGLDSQGERQRASDYLALEPDLLIHYNFANDSNGVVQSAQEIARNTGHLCSKVPISMRRSHVLNRLFGARLVPGDEAYEQALGNYTLTNLRGLIEAAHDAGVPIVLCSFAHPDVAHLEGSDLEYYKQVYNNRLGDDIYGYVRAVDVYNASIKGLCEELGLRYVPVAENVTGGPKRFIDHCHMYVNGIEAKASVIFDHVKDLVGQGLDARQDSPNE